LFLTAMLPCCDGEIKLYIYITNIMLCWKVTNITEDCYVGQNKMAREKNLAL